MSSTPAAWAVSAAAWWKRNVSVTRLFVTIGLFEAALTVLVVPGLPWWAVTLLLAAPLPLLAHRARPRLTILASAAMIFPLCGFELPPFAFIPLMFAVGSCMYQGHRKFTLAATMVLSGATMVVAVNLNGGWTVEAWRGGLLVIGWLHVALVAGESLRQRDAYIAAARENQREAAMRMAADERLRIARELHDSLTHSIAVVKVRSGVALHLARKEGRDTDTDMAAIAEAAGEAERELRATVQSLRASDGHHTLDEVDGLVERYEQHGLDVDAEVRACAARGALGHTAYRVIQEGLTNAARHSQGRRAAVRVRSDGGLVVAVVDDGTPVDPPFGNGLTGIRERVEPLGGDFYAGPRGGAPNWTAPALSGVEHQGFALAVRLPHGEENLKGDG
ncbi:sensor histidine kinase [Salininema proteolyticum]|uniref:histidine kinase n=1 Tax=Salininema proteolyticum TaxID=1607685 RepID=A0ABV8TWP5_9ACTN